MKAICTALLLALAFWLGTRYTLTPRASSGPGVPRVEQPSKASSPPRKVAKARPAASSSPASAATIDLGF